MTACDGDDGPPAHRIPLTNHVIMDRISGVALGDAGIAAVAVLLTVYEAWLFWNRPNHREHLWLAVICAATALHAGFTLDEMLYLDISYAPPFAGVWDPLVIAARKALESV